MLFIKGIATHSYHSVGVLIGNLLGAAFITFLVLYCIKKVVKRISKLRIEHKEMVEMWFKKPAHALLFLYLAGCLPLNYPRFLDYAADYALLRKVQAGSHPEKQEEYTFVYPLLLKYFPRTNPTDSYFQKGSDLIVLCLLHREDHHEEEALRAFDQALYFSPNRADIHQSRGRTLGYLQRYEEALRALDQAIHLEPENPSAYYGKGNVLLECDPPRYEEAQAAYTQAICLDPRLAYAYQDRGMAYRGLEKPEEARQDFEKAQELFDEEGAFKEKKDENAARSAVKLD